MKKRLLLLGLIAAILGFTSSVQVLQAQITIYTTTLSGPAESPPNMSPGTGTVTVTVNTTLNTMRVQCTFSGLTGTTTAAHIHAATAVANTSTAGVATQTPTFTGFPLGVTSGTYDNTFDMTLASSYNAAFITANGGTAASAFAALKAAKDAGKAYFNVHTSAFGGGEIRGFLTPCITTINAPTITQPTCALPTGTIVVNATGTSTLEYSVDNGTNWQPSPTFSGLSAGNYTIKVRLQASTTCEATYGSNPVVLNSPFSATAIDTWTGCVSTDWATPGNWQDGSVPTVTDDVNIPNVANDPIIGAGTAAVAKSVLVLGGTVLTINATGSLAINGSISPRHGLDNYGTLDNSGTIRVGNTAAVGAIGIVQRNGGTFNNKTGGAIYIDQTGSGQAFYTSGIVNNEATIEIGSNATVTGQGLYIETPTGTFNNKASSFLTINRSTTHGVENKGILDNYGTIRIGNITAIAGIGIVHRNGGTFNNKTNGAIYIDQTGSGQAFYSAGLVNNEASIKIGSNAAITGEGIRLEGNTFNNKTGGSIQIDQANSFGIRLLNSGTVFNNENLIEIGSLSNVKGTGIRNESGCTFNNKVGGDIRINQIGILNISVTGAIRNSGTFTNDAKITVGNIGLVYAQDGILNFSGSFTNNAAGIISIEKTWGNGIWNISGTFQNDGKITISNVLNANTGNFSTGILSTVPFTNSSGAEIHLDLVANGIISTSAFTNAGLIRMGENGPLTGSGIANVQGVNAVFNNNAGGDISIKQTAVDGVQNDVGSTFNNNACAKLTIFDNLNNASTFTNAGLFTVNTTQPHTNTGTVTNNGIIEYPQGNPIPNVTNNDVIVAPIFVCSTTLAPALQIGGMNSFNVGTTWYKEPSLTNAAGTYSPNTFTVTNLTVGNTYPLYFEITDPTNMCIRTVSISTAVNVPPVVSTPQTELCSGLNLTLSPTTGGTWMSSNPSFATVTNGGEVTGILAGIVNFTFTSTTTGCSATTPDITIKTTPSSVLTASKQDVCPNTEVSLNAHCSEVGSTVNWNPGGATVTPNAPDVAYTYKASCMLNGCTGNESVVEVRTHRILVDLKDVGMGTQPKALAAIVKDNLAPTNTFLTTNYPAPRLWTILASGCSASESAVFKLSGPVSFNAIDNNPPYALFANVGSDYFAIDHPNYGQGAQGFPVGIYNLTVDLRAADGVGGPFPKNRIATGSLLATRTLQFTIENTSNTREAGEERLSTSNSELTTHNWLAIFQNPVSKEIVLQVSGNIGEDIALLLMNLQGQIIQEHNVKLTSSQQYEALNVHNFNTGIYILKAIKDDKIKTLKVVKVE